MSYLLIYLTILLYEGCNLDIRIKMITKNPGYNCQSGKQYQTTPKTEGTIIKFFLKQSSLVVIKWFLAIIKMTFTPVSINILGYTPFMSNLGGKTYCLP